MNSTRSDQEVARLVAGADPAVTPEDVALTPAQMALRDQISSGRYQEVPVPRERIHNGGAARKTALLLVPAGTLAAAVTAVAVLAPTWSGVAPSVGSSGIDADSDGYAEIFETHQLPPLPERDIENWVMPLDRYLALDPFLANYAENLLVMPCMAAAGYEWTVPVQDIRDAPSATRNAVDRQVFTREIAASYGYHDAGPLAAPNAAWRQLVTDKQFIPADEERALVECLEQARVELPVPTGQMKLATTLAHQARDLAQIDPDVISAGRSWQECMASSGIADLPLTPINMPSPSMAQSFEIASASAEEIAIALRDAECRDTSGWDEALYNVEWAAQLQLLAENAAEIGESRYSVESIRAKTLEIIYAYSIEQARE